MSRAYINIVLNFHTREQYFKQSIGAVKFHAGKNPPPRFAKLEFSFENEYGGTLMKPLFANSYQIYFKSVFFLTHTQHATIHHPFTHSVIIVNGSFDSFHVFFFVLFFVF